MSGDVTFLLKNFFWEAKKIFCRRNINFCVKEIFFFVSHTDDASYQKNTINRHDIDAIILKINLPLLDDISRKQSALGSIANEHTATATGIRVIFCTSCQGRSDYGGGSYIRYVAGGKWFAGLSPLP